MLLRSRGAPAHATGSKHFSLIILLLQLKVATPGDRGRGVAKAACICGAQISSGSSSCAAAGASGCRRCNCHGSNARLAENFSYYLQVVSGNIEQMFDGLSRRTRQKHNGLWLSLVARFGIERSLKFHDQPRPFSLLYHVRNYLLP